MTNTPVIFAHRGASGTHPENTMAAFKAAVEKGAGGIELDVQLTKDGEVVIIHDEFVDRTTNGRGAVEHMTWDEISQLDAGSWFSLAFKEERIPKLRTFLTWASAYPMLQVNIELKTNKVPYHGIEEAVLKLVDEFGMKNRVIISSFNFDSLKRVMALDDTIAAAGLVWKLRRDARAKAKELGLTALHVQPVFLMSEDGKKALEENMIIRLYTINDVKQWKKIQQQDARVEAIITDFPEYFQFLF